MRNANIELLRIVSMVLIVLFHFSVHGTWPVSYTHLTLPTNSLV